MLPPHELKNKNFPKAVRGYSTVDVDEHIEFIIEKYTDLYRANDELERKLQKAEADLRNYRNDEESIRSALINAQRASAQIISEANERADVILRSAKTNCDKIVAEFNEQIREEREQLIKLRKIISDFKVSLFSQYTSHIEYIESISPEPTGELDEHLANADYTKLVVERIKKDITTGNVQDYGVTLPKTAQQEPEVLPEVIPEPEPDDDDEEPLDFEDLMTTIPQKLPEPKERDIDPEPEDEDEELEEEIDEEDSVPTFVSQPFEIPESDPEPVLELKKKPVISPVSQEKTAKTLSMKDRIRQLNKKLNEEDQDDDNDGNNFDEDYDDFVKSLEVNKKKKKNKPTSIDD